MTCGSVQVTIKTSADNKDGLCSSMSGMWEFMQCTIAFELQEQSRIQTKDQMAVAYWRTLAQQQRVERSQFDEVSKQFLERLRGQYLGEDIVIPVSLA